MTAEEIIADMHSCARRVAEMHMVAIEDYARAAATKGFNLAVSPSAMGEVPDNMDPGQPNRFTVKTDTMLLKPGTPAPAGWTLYNFAEKESGS